MSIPPLLRQSTKPLEKYFNKSVVEIRINKPGEVILQYKDKKEIKKDPELSLSNLHAWASILATISGQKYDPDLTPMLATTLPHYKYRVQVVGGPTASNGISITMRRQEGTTYPLESYVPLDGQDLFNCGISAEKVISTLNEALIFGRDILVVGGTNSGKTTLLNSMIPLIPEDTRIITIEDTPELFIPHQDCVSLYKSKSGTDTAKITYVNLIDAVMRMTPGRIIMGELDPQSTCTFLRLSDSGHSGTMTTVHAKSSPMRVMHALRINVQMSNSLSDDAAREFIFDTLELFVFTKRLTHNRYGIELYDFELLRQAGKTYKNF